MAMFFLAALLLATHPAWAVNQFRAADKSTVPKSLIESNSLCPDPLREQCWENFQRTGQAWAGDVNEDKAEELLIFPGSGYAGSGGQTVFLYQKKGERWAALAEFWQDSPHRFDILPVVRNGYHDLRLQVDRCLKWNGQKYVLYGGDDYHGLSPAFFDAMKGEEAEIFWMIRYYGQRRFKLQPQWLSGNAPEGRHPPLDDSELGLKWIAIYKGGIWGFTDHKGYLVLPRPAYKGAEYLALEGEWLVVYAEYGSVFNPRPVARYNRFTNELEIEGGVEIPHYEGFP